MPRPKGMKLFRLTTQMTGEKDYQFVPSVQNSGLSDHRLFCCLRTRKEGNYFEMVHEFYRIGRRFLRRWVKF